MTADPLAPLVDELADRIIDRLAPALIEAAESRRLPALAVPVAEAARSLRVHPDTVRKLITDGHLDRLEDVGTVMVTVASLHAYAGHPLAPQLHAVGEVAS